MPSVIETTTALSPGRTFTRTGLMEIVKRRTKNVGKDLDLSAEFLLSLQELCGEKKWYWRKKQVKFDTVAGTPTYDLSEIIEKWGASIESYIKVKIVDPSSGKLCVLTALHGLDSQECAMEATTQAKPEHYFPDLDTSSTSQVIRLTDIPDGIYPTRVSFWAVPVMLPEKQDNQIPLIPGHMHWLAALAFEKNILRTALGEEASEYMAAQNAYDRALARSSIIERFAEDEHDDNPEGNWGSGREGIRST